MASNGPPLSTAPCPVPLQFHSVTYTYIHVLLFPPSSSWKWWLTCKPKHYIILTQFITKLFLYSSRVCNLFGLTLFRFCLFTSLKLPRKWILLGVSLPPLSLSLCVRKVYIVTMCSVCNSFMWNSLFALKINLICARLLASAAVLLRP
jgi:hypothetical protein